MQIAEPSVSKYAATPQTGELQAAELRGDAVQIPLHCLRGHVHSTSSAPTQVWSGVGTLDADGDAEADRVAPTLACCCVGAALGQDYM